MADNVTGALTVAPSAGACDTKGAGGRFVPGVGSEYVISKYDAVPTPLTLNSQSFVESTWNPYAGHSPDAHFATNVPTSTL